MTASVAGLATLLLANAALFQVLKLAGAAYLVWMGIALWRRRAALPDIAARTRASGWRLLRRAFLVSMSNPKSILAYFAVFAHFVSPDLALGPQLTVLVPTVLVITGLVYFGYSALGLGVGRLLATVRRRLVFNRTIGSFYVAAGLGLALSGTSVGAQAHPRP